MFKFCPYCAASLEAIPKARYCPMCGNSLPRESKARVPKVRAVNGETPTPVAPQKATEEPLGATADPAIAAVKAKPKSSKRPKQATSPSGGRKSFEVTMANKQWEWLRMTAFARSLHPAELAEQMIREGHAHAKSLGFFPSLPGPKRPRKEVQLYVEPDCHALLRDARPRKSRGFFLWCMHVHRHGYENTPTEPPRIFSSELCVREEPTILDWLRQQRGATLEERKLFAERALRDGMASCEGLDVLPSVDLTMKQYAGSLRFHVDEDLRAALDAFALKRKFKNPAGFVRWCFRQAKEKAERVADPPPDAPT